MQDNLFNSFEREISTLKTLNHIEIVPIISVPSNIYCDKDSPRVVCFRLENQKNADLIMQTVLIMPSGARISLENSSKNPNNEISVTLPDLSELYGIFYIEVTIRENSKILCYQKIPFSHIRTGCGYFKKSGFCIHLIYHDTPDTRLCTDHIERLGVRLVRDDYLWNFCETEKGKPHTLDNYNNTLEYMIQYNIVPHLLLLYGNQFYDDGKAPISTEALNGYVNFCKAVVKSYKGKIKNYEIWNEYNLGFGKAPGTPEKYAVMLKMAYIEIKKIDPEITVTAAVTCGTQPEWIRRMLRAGTYNYFDEISIHPYCGVPDSTYPDEMQGQAEANVQSYIDVISEFGIPKPVWISEMGWTTSAQGSPGSTNRTEQAACITRLFAITETSKIIKRTTMYDFRDDGDDPFEMEHHWGLVESMNSIVPDAAKESYAAVSCLNYMIGNADYICTTVTDKIKHITYKENDTTINLLWSLDGQKNVLFEVTGDAFYYDMYGNQSELSTENCKANLTVNENPCYIKGADIKIVSAKYSKIVYDYPYTLSAVPELRDDGWYINAVVHNHSEILNGRVRIELPELNISGNYERFTLKKEECFKASVKVGNPDYSKLFRALVDINLENGIRKIEKELVSFLSVSEDKKTHIILDAKNNYVRLGGCERPELKADISLRCDSKKLYVTADVQDKSHIQVGTTGDLWQDIWDGDGLELIIQPLYDGNKDITRYNHIGLAYTSNTHETVAWRWHTVSNHGMGRLRTCDFTASREGGVTKYKAAFLWSELLPPNVKLDDCDSFGFVARVNFCESNERTNDGYMQLYGGLGSWRAPFSYQPCEFGRFIISK